MIEEPLFALIAIALGAQGQIVANLHQLLIRLNIGHPLQDELAGSYYGLGTRRLIGQLQDQLHLDPPVRGVVDDMTAAAANWLAVEHELFNVVEGTVKRDGAPVEGARILVADFSHLDATCAETTTGRDGRYRVWYDPRFYAGPPFQTFPISVVVTATDVDDVTVRSGPQQNPNGWLLVDLMMPSRLRVRGQVVDADTGTPHHGIEVEVLDRDIGSDTEPLGTTTTGEDGRFAISYEPSQFEHGEGIGRRKPTADLVFRLRIENTPIAAFTIVREPTSPNEEFFEAGPVSEGDMLLGIRARDDELVRLLVRGLAVPAGPTEYERLVAALEPLTQMRPLEEFDEATTQDVSFAAHEIDEDTALVADLVTAHKLVVTVFSHDFPPTVFYGLARRLGMRDVRSIATRSPDAMTIAVKDSIGRHEIPAADNLEELIRKLHKMAVQHVTHIAGSDAHAVDLALSPIVHNADRRAELIASSVKYPNRPEEFWTQVATDHPDLPLDQLQFAVQLAAAADSSTPLITAIQQELPEATSMRTLALDVEPDRLAELIATSGAMPATRFENESDDAARVRLRRQFIGLLEATQPTSVVARLARHWTALDPVALPEPTADLLARAVRVSNFDLISDDVETFIGEHADLLFSDQAALSARDEAVGGLLRVQRLFRTSTGSDTMDLLARAYSPTGAPFCGAADIARYSKSSFLANFDSAPPEMRKPLERVHDRATAIADTVATLMIAHHQDQHAVTPAAAQDYKKPEDPAPKPPPDWTTFFGSEEQCECGECRSVIGPAAYFCDLLEFLDKRCQPDSRGITLLDLLIGHPTKKLHANDAEPIRGIRPDLAHIKLTCQNVNTTIPTIDLINQILESAVAFDGLTLPLATDANNDIIQPPTARPSEISPGTTDAELSAAPEHVIDRAYDEFLSRSDCPILLPFDRKLATARVFFEQAGTSRAEALALFTPTGPAPLVSKAAVDRRVAAETLGLFRRDYEILTTTTLSGKSKAVQPQTLFGFPKEPPTIVPPWTETIADEWSSRQVLQALGLSFPELVALLRTRFVGGVVPDAEDQGTAAHLLITIDQLTELRQANYVVKPGSGIDKALTFGGITPDQVKAWVDSFGHRIATTVVLDPPASCDPDKIGLIHLDGSAITDTEWVRMHRFVRLARRMHVGLADLDIALAAIDGDANPTFGPGDLKLLAKLSDLRKSLEIDWPAAAALVSDIDTRGPACLYDELFIRSGLARAHRVFRRQSDGSVLTAPNTPLDEGIPGLASAFETDAADLSTAARRLKLTKLTIAAVSALYRTALLANHLGVSAPQFVILREIYAHHPNAPQLSEVTDPEQLQSFLDWCRTLLAAGLSPELLAELTDTPSDGSGTDLASADLGAVLDSLVPAVEAADDRDSREAAEEAQLREIAQRYKNSGLLKELKKVEEELDRRNQARGLSREALVFGALGAWLKLGTDLIIQVADKRKELKTTLLKQVSNTDRPNALGLLRQLQRVANLATASGLPEEQFEAALTRFQRDAAGAAAVLYDGVKKPDILAIVGQVAVFVQLATESKRPQALTNAVLALSDSAGDDWPDSAVGVAAEWLNIEPTSVQSALNIGLAALKWKTARIRPLTALALLRRCTRIAARLGQRPDEVGDSLGEPLASAALSALMRGLSSGYPAATWARVSRQLSDTIREASRDALVGYLMHRDGLQNADQLFEKLLIDPQISPFALTSPISRAILTVHTYIQLIQLRRIPGASPAQLNPAELEVMQSRTLWTARVETLLFPHWLLNPSWNRNKSLLFQEAESALRQADATPANVRQVYEQYLTGLSEVATVEVVGTFLQTQFVGKEASLFTSVLHVVARTRSAAARKYFYRRLNQYEHSREWTDWEPITADIQGVEQDRTGPRIHGADSPPTSPGVHLLPVLWRDQIHLFWATFVPKNEGRTTPTTIQFEKDVVLTQAPRPYWDIKLCWTRREAAGWTPKQQSTALAETWWGKTPFTQLKQLPLLPDPSRIVLQASLAPDRYLHLHLSLRRSGEVTESQAVFALDGVTGEMYVGEPYINMPPSHPPFKADTLTGSYLGFTVSGKVRAVADPTNNPDGDLLFTAQNPVRIITLNQGNGQKLQSALFLDLRDRAYYLETRPGTTQALKKVEPNPGPILPPVAYPGHDTPFSDLLQSAAYAFSSQLKKRTTPNPWVIHQAAMISASASKLLQSSGSAMTAASHRTGAGRDPRLVDPKFAPEIYVGDITSGAIDPVVALHPGWRPVFDQYKWVDAKALDLTVVPFSHPFVDDFLKLLRRHGLDALVSPATQEVTKLAVGETFADRCPPNPDRTRVPAVEGLDFGPETPFGKANWELFYFLLDQISSTLMEQNKLDAAYQVLRMYFDYLGAADNPNDAWRFLELRKAKAVRLDDMLTALSRPPTDPERQDLEKQIEIMRKYPFDAHRIAQFRPIAHKKWTLIKAVQLDLAFERQFHLDYLNPESFNRAFPYALAARAKLGRLPEPITQRVSMAPRSYAELRGNLDALGNVMLTAENKLAPAAGTAVSTGSSDDTAANTTIGLAQRGAIGYFCIPADRKLLDLHAEVEDRLYKLRNSMNLDGEQVQIPLFAPRIDPAALAEALAAGLSIAEIVQGFVRRPAQTFRACHAELVTLAQELITIGQQLLDADNQYDDETLTRTRAAQEKTMAGLINTARRHQTARAREEITALQRQRDGQLEDWKHFRRLLGIVDDIEAPTHADENGAGQGQRGSASPARPINLEDADKVSFKDIQVIASAGIPIFGGLLGELPLPDVTLASVPGITMAPGKILAEERQELERSFAAVKDTYEASAMQDLAAMLSMIPTIGVNIQPVGLGPTISFGFGNLAGVANSQSGRRNASASMQRFLAEVHAKQGSMILREHDWVAGLNRAAAAVRELDQRITAANVFVKSCQAEEDAQVQAENDAAAIEKHHLDKLTNLESQDFRKKKLRELFRKACDVGMESLQATSAAYKWERDDPQLFNVRPPANAREQWLFGHEVMTTAQQMLRSYNATTPTGPQVIQQFSLNEIDPWALLDLREDGEAKFELPEVLYDIDHPTHYNRRISSIQVSVLCNRSSLVGVSGTFSIDKSWLRKTPNHDPIKDSPPIIQGITSIAISTGRDDSGMFEQNPELYRPFQGLGAVCECTLKFPKWFPKFPYREITDVIVTVRLDALSAGGEFGQTREKKIKTALNKLMTHGLNEGIYRLISLRHNRSTDWATFRNGEGLHTTISAENDLPYLLRRPNVGNESAFKLNPTLQDDVVAIRLPKGQPKGVGVKLGKKKIPSGQWKVDMAPAVQQNFGEPSETEDVLLLARFTL